MSSASSILNGTPSGTTTGARAGAGAVAAGALGTGGADSAEAGGVEAEGAGAAGTSVRGFAEAVTARFGSRMVSIMSLDAPASVSLITALTERSNSYGELRICCRITAGGTL